MRRVRQVEAAQSASSDGGEEPFRRDGLTASERGTIRQWAAHEGIEVESRGILGKVLVANGEA